MDQAVIITGFVGSVVSTLSVATGAILWVRRSGAAEARREERLVAAIERMERSERRRDELICELREWTHELREWRAAQTEAARHVERRLRQLEEAPRGRRATG